MLKVPKKSVSGGFFFRIVKKKPDKCGHYWEKKFWDIVQVVLHVWYWIRDVIWTRFADFNN